MRLLDLFSGGGGAAMGYARAGFEVVGVDINPQPHYPFEFHQADAMTYPLDGFDVIHASPPCQGYSDAVVSDGRWDRTDGINAPRLIPALHERLAGHVYVIENVRGALGDMRCPILLCGFGFGLPISRHRYFDTGSWRIVARPVHPVHDGRTRAYAEARGWDYRDMTVTGKGRRAGTTERWKEVMGWPTDQPVTQHQLREAIPPAYTEYIGRQLMESMR